MASFDQPMTLLPTTRETLGHLTTSGHDLLRDLETRRSASTTGRRSDVADNIRHYLAMLIAGLSANDVHMALRAANLLTTVGKGVGDAEISGEKSAIAERAFAVTKNAIQAAKQLREDAGMAF